MFRIITIWFAISHPLRVHVHTIITITAISLAAFTVLYIFRHLLILCMMLKNPLYAPLTAVKSMWMLLVRDSNVILRLLVGTVFAIGLWGVSMAEMCENRVRFREGEDGPSEGGEGEPRLELSERV